MSQDVEALGRPPLVLHVVVDTKLYQTCQRSLARFHDVSAIGSSGNSSTIIWSLFLGIVPAFLPSCEGLTRRSQDGMASVGFRNPVLTGPCFDQGSATKFARSKSPRRALLEHATTNIGLSSTISSSRVTMTTYLPFGFPP